MCVINKSNRLEVEVQDTATLLYVIEFIYAPIELDEFSWFGFLLEYYYLRVL